VSPAQSVIMGPALFPFLFLTKYLTHVILGSHGSDNVDVSLLSYNIVCTFM
jgi:hypothetical protein